LGIAPPMEDLVSIGGVDVRVFARCLSANTPGTRAWGGGIDFSEAVLLRGSGPCCTKQLS